MDIAIDEMSPADWPAVRDIYQEGLDTRQATFETAVPSWQDWDAGKRPESRLVARSGSQVVAWAALSPVSGRAVYAGVAEHSIYVTAAARGRGVGKTLLQALITASEQAGIWTLQTSIFPENTVSIKLHLACGFRIVGKRVRIAQHYGIWRDTVLLERRSSLTSIQIP